MEFTDTNSNVEFIRTKNEYNVPYKAHIYPESYKLPHVFNLKSIYPESKEVMDEMFEFFSQF